MKKVIGIIGPTGAGKDTAADYLLEKLFLSKFPITQPLHDLYVTPGSSPTRQELVRLGTQLAQEKGPDYLAQEVLKKIDTTGIIVGMRQVQQIEYLKQHADLILLAINASPEIRFQRALARNQYLEAKTLEEFIQHETQENQAPNVQRLFGCMKLANKTIENNGTIEDFYRALDYFNNSLSEYPAFSHSALK